MIFNEDCLTGMKRLIQQGVMVDLIITDPPYLSNYKTNARINKNHRFCSPISNDKDSFNLVQESISLCSKLLKDGGGFIVFAVNIILIFSNR